jgi:hypothetical protein
MAAEGPAGWVNILADDFTATVSTRVLLAQADSHLAQVSEHCKPFCAVALTGNFALLLTLLCIENIPLVKMKLKSARL